MKSLEIKILSYVVSLFLMIVMFSCSIDNYHTRKMYADNQVQLYIAENQYNVSADSLGFAYIPISEGNGVFPQNGDVIAFHYIGYYLDGKVFDSSYDRSYPLIVKLGEDQLIKGLEYAIMKMDKGAKSKVVIPFYLAYDDMENAPVPPFSNLVFELELLDIDKR